MLSILVAVATLFVTDQTIGSGLSYGMGGGGTTAYERHGDSYSGGASTVPRSAVEALRKALVASERVQAFEPRAFGITPEWVAASRSKLLRAAGIPLDAKLSPALEAALSFDGIAAITKRRYEGGVLCDDCLSVTVGVRLDGPDGFEVSSDQDIATMIPWRVKLGGRTWKTCSLDVARAVAVLLSGADRKLIENVGFWPEGLLRDPLMFVDLGKTAADELGVAKARQLPGAAAMLHRFDIVSASLWYGRWAVTLRPKHRAPYDEVSWSDARDATSWDPLLRRLDQIERLLSRTRWLRSVRRGRRVGLSFVTRAPSQLALWGGARLRGAPDAQLGLSGDEPASRASLLLGPDEERVLVEYMQNVPEIDGHTAGMTGGVRTYLVGTPDGVWQRYQISPPPPMLRRFP